MIRQEVPAIDSGLEYMNWKSHITGQQSITLFLGGHEMTGISGSSTGSGSEQTVVVVEVRAGDELVWPSRGDMVSWQIGERVSYMGSRGESCPDEWVIRRAYVRLAPEG